MSTSTSPWLNNCQGAISLSFDDGVESQLKLAIPMLDKYGLQATFYVNPRDNYKEQLIPWRTAAQSGHEIGNHTINHPCSKNFAFICAGGGETLCRRSWQRGAPQ
ncbi:MAG: polysaccharide deacetylase family protein [Chloroflexi bacterium]|nr:polysaccharide deacetylase family protein [Chloroflexota bacterium]